jgi:hypothetical protein
MSKSFTKTIATVLTVALVAGSTLAPTDASAKDGRRTNLAIGALVGLGGALLGAAAASSQPRYVEDRYAPQRPVRFAAQDEEDEDCFEKPIKRFDRYSGETIVIGYKTVCR